MVEANLSFWVRELRLRRSELGSSTQVQRLGVRRRHGKSGLEGRPRRLDNNHTLMLTSAKRTLAAAKYGFSFWNYFHR